MSYLNCRVCGRPLNVAADICSDCWNQPCPVCGKPRGTHMGGFFCQPRTQQCENCGTVIDGVTTKSLKIDGVLYCTRCAKEKSSAKDRGKAKKKPAPTEVPIREDPIPPRGAPQDDEQGSDRRRPDDDLPEITFPGSVQPQLPPMPIPESPSPSGDVQVERPTGGPSTQGSPDMPGFDGDAQGEEHTEIFHEYQSLKNVFGEEMFGEKELGGVLGPVKPYLTEKQPPADDDVPGSRGNDPFRQAVEAEQYLQDRDAGQLPLGDISGSPVGSSGAPDMPDLSGGLGDPGNQGGSGPGGAAGQIEGNLSDIGSAGDTRFGEYPDPKGNFEEWVDGWSERNQNNPGFKEWTDGFDPEEIREGGYSIYKATHLDDSSHDLSQVEIRDQIRKFQDNNTFNGDNKNIERGEYFNQLNKMYEQEYNVDVRACLGSENRRIDYGDGASFMEFSADGSLYEYKLKTFGENSHRIYERWRSGRGDAVDRTWTLEWKDYDKSVNVYCEEGTLIREGADTDYIQSAEVIKTVDARGGVDISNPQAVVESVVDEVKGTPASPQFEQKKQDIIKKFPKTNLWRRK